MKKSLITFGTLLTLAVPVATVAACDSSNSKDNKGTSSTGGDNKNASSTEESVYVQKRKDSEYPTMNQVLYDDFNSQPSMIAYKFYQLKKADYFNQYKSHLKDMHTTYWFDRYIWMDWRNSSIGIVVFNWHELYDWVHLQAPQNFPYK